MVVTSNIMVIWYVGDSPVVGSTSNLLEIYIKCWNWPGIPSYIFEGYKTWEMQRNVWLYIMLLYALGVGMPIFNRDYVEKASLLNSPTWIFDASCIKKEYQRKWKSYFKRFEDLHLEQGMGGLRGVATWLHILIFQHPILSKFSFAFKSDGLLVEEEI